jgi:hypothetical protein
MSLRQKLGKPLVDSRSCAVTEFLEEFDGFEVVLLTLPKLGRNCGFILAYRRFARAPEWDRPLEYSGNRCLQSRIVSCQGLLGSRTAIPRMEGSGPLRTKDQRLE